MSKAEEVVTLPFCFDKAKFLPQYFRHSLTVYTNQSLTS